MDPSIGRPPKCVSTVQFSEPSKNGPCESAFKSDADNFPLIGNATAEELLTPLLRQHNFWCESGVCLAGVIQDDLFSPRFFREVFWLVQIKG